MYNHRYLWYNVGNTYARCTICGIDISVAHGGRNDVTKHIGVKSHREKSAASSSSRSLSTFFEPSASVKVIEAETRWALFVAHHNIAFLSSDHATRLFTHMFSDSKIAKNFSCGRTKCTAIIKQALAPYYTTKVKKSLLNPFSVMMDESNDKSNKSCIILVRVLDPEIGDVCTRFVDMPVVNVGTAKNLFDALKSSMADVGVDFLKAVSFMSDTTNVMKGNRSGVQKLIRDENPSVYDAGCICHLADLAVKAGMKTLPIDIDQLFIDIYYYFYHSSKRKQEFNDLWCSLFSSDPGVLLKHCTTRWLSLLRCVNRYISQYDGLVSYFLSCEEETAKVRSIIERLENPLTKPILHFLSFILPHMDRFNCVFQKSTENTTSQLYSEMSRLVRLYAANVLTTEAIKSVGDDLKSLKFTDENLLGKEDLGIGETTWTLIAALEEECDIAPFFDAVKKFYVATIQKMIKKFPFGDTLLQDLEILIPDKVTSFSINTIFRLAKRFPQLELSDPNSLDRLREEYLDFTLSPSELPTQTEYMAADKTRKPCVGKYWRDVGKIVTLYGQPRFPCLYKLMSGLLTIMQIQNVVFRYCEKYILIRGPI